MANKKEVIRQLKEHLHLYEDELVWELLEILRNNIRNKIRENKKKKGIEKIFLARILLNGIKKQKKKQEEQKDIRGIVFKDVRKEELKKHWLDIKTLLDLGYGSYRIQKILEEKGIKVSRPVLVKIIKNYKEIKKDSELEEKEKGDGKLKG